MNQFKCTALKRARRLGDESRTKYHTGASTRVLIEIFDRSTVSSACIAHVSRLMGAFMFKPGRKQRAPDIQEAPGGLDRSREFMLHLISLTALAGNTIQARAARLFLNTCLTYMSIFIFINSAVNFPVFLNGEFCHYISQV